MDKEDGQLFVKKLAYFVRTHEKSLANALQFRQGPKNGQAAQATGGAAGGNPKASSSSTTNALAAALSLPYLGFSSHNVKPIKLTLTPHHLFYLLSRFEELGILVGPMNIRLEHIQTEVLPGNYVSFMGSAPKYRGRPSDTDSIHSVSSVRSAMSSMSSMWSRFTISDEAGKQEKQKVLEKEDLKYIYSAFTKIPCLKLSPDHRAKLIAGYEEFPFDTAVPLFAFKNISALELTDLDFRQLYGWDRLAEQLRSLTIKNGSVDDLADLLINVVLDDMDKRRRRSSRPHGPHSPAAPWPTSSSPAMKQVEMARSEGASSSPVDVRPTLGSPQAVSMARGGSSEGQRSASPARPVSSRHNSSYAHPRSSTPKFRRSSGSSSSSIHSGTPRNSASNLLQLGTLQPSKWRFLRHLSLTENGITSISSLSLAPLAGVLHSLDLSNNLFTEIPDSLATLTSLKALNLSNCMIYSLHSLARNPLPAIEVINLRSNRLSSLAGVERIFSLEKIDLRDNRLTDPTEVARLTRIPEMRQVYVHKNPFIRTHSNYRVTIFNLFRASPGYTDDVVLDSTGPTYSERRQLIDRVPEAPGVPVVRTEVDEERAAGLKSRGTGPTSAQTPPRATERSRSSLAGTGEQDTATQRRRKGPKRRIVELSHQEDSPPAAYKASQDESVPSITPTKANSGPGLEHHVAQSYLEPPPVPALDTSSASPSPLDTPQAVDSDDDDDSPVPEPEEVAVQSDIYRQKIEALKTDFGEGWLSALHGDKDKWERRASEQERDDSPARTIRPQRVDSKGVAAPGRMLG